MAEETDLTKMDFEQEQTELTEIDFRKNSNRDNSMQLMLNRVDDFEKGEPVKIRVAGTDLPDSMFPHKNSRVRIVHQIA